MVDFSQKDSVFCPNHTLNLGGNVCDLSVPKIMGILNVTPDSFFDGGTAVTEKAILEKATRMLQEGADILDLGGYSSRPGAVNITAEEEIRRVIPAIRLIAREFPTAVMSVDTFRAQVAEKALQAGALVVNDISAGESDENMFPFIASAKVPYIMMHMRGTPQTMRTLTHYEEILSEIVNYFQRKIFTLRSLGVSDIVIDPGFGFSKTREQSFFLLNHLKTFRMLDCPLLAGVSRKSMIFKTLETTATHALNGTTVLHTIALQNGASILRVHDVKEAKETIRLVTELQNTTQID